MIYCVNCGKEAQVGFKYCPHCGKPLLIDNLDISLLNLTEKPVFMKKGTSGTKGTEGEYVLFGDWPQTIKEKWVDINTSVTYNFNGRMCYKGSDGAFYIKLNCTPHEFWDDKDICPSSFSNGQELTDGKDYYFKIEPIKWRILSHKYNGGMLLLAENVLANAEDFYCYLEDNRVINNKTINPNNYEYSNIRAYLNGFDNKEYKGEDYSNIGFLNNAFTSKAQELINTTSLQEFDNVNDKVFILNKKDLTNTFFGFNYSPQNSLERKRQFTDYAKGKGVYAEPVEGYEKHTDWWIRDAIENTTTLCYTVNNRGAIVFDNANDVCITLVGVVPAIVISSKNS